MTAAVAERAVAHHYEPRGAAIELMRCRAGEVLLSGPAGTGKSRACLEKVHLMCLANPGMRALFLRKTQKSLASTGLVTFREKVAAEGIAAGVLKWFGGSTQEAASYRYRNGSVIVVGGLDDPTKIMSSEYDVIYVQEATELTPDDWEACTTRLRNGRVSFQQLLADCNPSTPTHWLKKRCDTGQAVMLYSRHEDNPIYFGPDGQLTPAGQDYIQGKLDKLTGVRKERLRYGRWAAAEGVVYDAFDPAVHLIDTMPDGWETWTRWWGVDFGYANPFVCGFWAESPDGALYRYREIYMTRRLVEDHARQILSLVRAPREGLDRPADPDTADDWEWTEPKPRAIVCDHDAEDRATLERHLGMSTVAARKAPKAGQNDLVGLQEVQARFKVQPNGLARLYILRDCLVERDKELDDAGLPCCLAEEIPGYVWPADATGKPDKREHPVKENDHGCDETRYIVAERDISGRPRVRWL
jgi:phage terminase large subunit